MLGIKFEGYQFRLHTVQNVLLWELAAPLSEENMSPLLLRLRQHIIDTPELKGPIADNELVFDVMVSAGGSVKRYELSPLDLEAGEEPIAKLGTDDENMYAIPASSKEKGGRVEKVDDPASVAEEVKRFILGDHSEKVFDILAEQGADADVAALAAAGCRYPALLIDWLPILS